MGLLNLITRPFRSSAKTTRRASQRVCRFEQLEPRIALSANLGPEIVFGTVYTEQSDPQTPDGDHEGDLFQAAWVGGGANTEVKQIVISGDFDGLGFSTGDVFFDHDNNAPGVPAGAFSPFTIDASSDVTQVKSATIINGGADLVIEFFTSDENTGNDVWKAGDKFVFTIDVDENDLIPNPQVEGAEFEVANVLATFKSTDGSYQEVTAGGLADVNTDGKRDGGFVDEYTLPAQLVGLLPTDTGNLVNDPTAAATFSTNQIPEPVTITGFVYHDQDLDEFMDEGEGPVTDGNEDPIPVTVELWHSDDGVNYTFTGQTTDTDANGFYSFTHECDGYFKVVQPNQPSGYFSTTPDEVFTGYVGPGQTSTGNKFGEALPGTLSGHVYEDNNDNGNIDGGEAGINVVQVDLTDSNGNMVSTTTDASGFYQFTNLDPTLTYTITEVQPGPPTHLPYFDGQDTLGTLGGDDSVNDVFSLVSFTQSGQSGTDYDFGELKPAAISGYVYQDLNDDGSMGNNEPGIADVTLRLLDGDGNPVLDGGGNPITTTTNGDGFYRFDNLDPNKTYGVEEVQPPNFFDGQDQVGTAGGTIQNDPLLDRITGINGLQPGVEAVNYKFGELPPAAISGFVYQDLNDNGVMEGNEPGIPNTTLLLLDANGNVVLDGGGNPVTTTTDGNGFYRFSGLDPNKTYGIRELQPSGFFDGQDQVGTAGGSIQNDPLMDEITGINNLQPGVEAVNYKFGELPPAAISGVVYQDLNDNGVMEGNEPGIAGVTILLLDSNGDSVLDAGGNPVTTTTDTNGFYRFDGLDPHKTYGLKELQPSGFFDGQDQVGTAGGTVHNDPLMDEITGINNLQPGVEAVNYKFGELPPAAVSGFVYQDLNEDGQMGNAEPGIAGVTILLLDANGNSLLDGGGNPITTTTDTNGFYRFDDLDPHKTYGLKELQPGGFFDGQDLVGTAGGSIINNEQMDQIVGINQLQPGVEAVNYKFGELPPAAISGVVYVDQDANGQMGANEPGIPGVTIELLDANDNPVLDGGGNPITTTTAADGSFRFDGLDPRQTYGLHEVQPTAYDDGAELVGSAGGHLPNPDTDHITRISGLMPGQEAVNYKFGELEKPTISGYVFQDGPPIVLAPGQDPATVNVAALRDGVRTPDDTPLAGVTLRLADGAGNLLTDGGGNPIVAVTDVNGFYQFTGLSAGTYTVLQEHPSGYVDGIDTPGTTGGVATNPGDAIAQITLSHGQHSQENNFSEVVLRTTPPEDPPPEDPPTFFSNPPSSTPPPRINGGMGPGPGLAPPPGSPQGPGANVVFFGGGDAGTTPAIAAAPAYTFHLSVVDAGDPRGEFFTAGFARDNFRNVSAANLAFNARIFSDAHARMDEAQWLFAKHQDPVNVQYVFGSPDGIPVTGDFDGDGITEAGVYRGGEWFIDVNGNGQWDEDDLWAKLGTGRDQPVTGDWDGDGKTDIGIFGPEWRNDPRYARDEAGLPDRENETARDAKRNQPEQHHVPETDKRELVHTARGTLRKEVVDHVFYYGDENDIAVAGDWNGDGVSTIGVFSGGTWILDDNGDGRWLPGETMVEFGNPGDIPVVGDWDGDGTDDIGVYQTGTWVLDDGNHTLDPTDRVERLGGSGDKPVVGDWDGDGTDEPGLYRDNGVQRGDGT